MKSKHYLAFISSTLLLVALSCSFKSPQAPSWHTQLNVPLIDRAYTVAEIVEDEEKFLFDSQGRLGFHFEESIAPTTVGENFKLDGFAQSFQVGLTDLEVPTFNISYDRFFLSQLCSETQGKEGQRIVLHACTFQRVSGEKHSDPNFRSATIATGQGRVYVANRLPVPLENVTLQLRDGATGDITISSPRISRINAGDSATVSFSLNGRRIPEENHWLISGSIPGSSGAAVLIQNNLSVDVLTQIDQLRVSRMEAKFPGISLMMDKVIELLPDMTISVQELAFQQGSVTITLDNKTPFSSSDLTMQLAEIKHRVTGQPLTFSLGLTPFVKSEAKLDLRQYVAHLDLPADGEKQNLDVKVSGFTADLGDQFVRLDENSTITAKVVFGDLIIDYLSGRSAEQQITLPPVIKSVDLPERLDDLDNVHFSAATMTMDLYNTVQMPLRFSGSLEASNDKGEKVFFTLDQSVNPGNGDSEARTRLPIFTAQNSDMVKFMDIRPNRFIVQGQAWVGDGITVGRIQASDYLRAEVVVDVPARISWTAKEVHLDTTQIQIKPASAEGNYYDNDEIKRISGDVTDNLVSAVIQLKIDNHLPVGGTVQLHLAEALAQLHDKPEVILGPVKLPAATVDVLGQVLQARHIEATVTLSEEEMAIFKNSGGEIKPVFIATELKLDGSEGQERQFFSDDYVLVQALLTLNVLVKKE